LEIQNPKHLRPRFLNELAALERVNHPNIVGLIDASAEAVYRRKHNKGFYKIAYICTEFASLGNLFNLI
jgi:serine/threonine protein kinase